MVTIAVPVLNEAKNIAAILDRILLFAPADAEIFVLDGGSTDCTMDIVKGYASRGVKLIRNRHRYQSAAINLAAKSARITSEVLIRCDAHQIYPIDYVSRLLQTIMTTGSDSVVVSMISKGDKALPKAIAWVSNSFIGNGGAKHRGSNASGYVDHGHHAAFRLDTFRRLGGYDPTFTHNEDAEFDARLTAAGGRIYLDASVPVTYEPRDTLAGLGRQYFNYGFGRAKTVRRHPHSLRLRQLAVPLNFILQIASILLALVNPVTLIAPLLYLTSLFGFSVTMAVRHKSLAALLCGPAALVMHSAWAAGFLSSFLFHSRASHSDVKPQPRLEPLVYAPEFANRKDLPIEKHH